MQSKRKRTSRLGTTETHGRNGPPIQTSLDEKNVGAVVALIVDTLALYGFRKSKYSVKRSLEHWMGLVKSYSDDKGSKSILPDAWMKVAKYKLAAFFSAHLGGQSLPSRPFSAEDNPECLVGGKAYKFIRSLKKRAVRSHSDRLRWQSLIQTILNGVKKGCPRASEELLDKAAQETVDKLTTSPPPRPLMGRAKWSDFSDEDTERKINPFLSRLELENQFRRTVRELYTGRTLDEVPKYFFPSTSANYIRSRGKGGAVSALKEHPSLQSFFTNLPTNLVEFSTIASEPEEERIGSSGISQYYRFDDTNLRSWFDLFYQRCRDVALEEEPLVEPVALAESLKIRVITKGPAVTYSVLKPLQKFLWGVLKEHPAFELVGRPIDSEYILNRMGQKRCVPGLFYVSGDYKDATNEIESWVSNVIVDEISKTCDLPVDISVLFKRSLTQHKIVGADGVERQQVAGQLMGSVTSFPILCIANAAICRLALEVGDDRKWSLKDARLAINGDDCVFKTNRFGFETWQDAGRMMGLSESVGKTYISDTYLNMNSTGYCYDEGNSTPFISYRQGHAILRTNPFYEIPFINWGLILGMKRSSGQVSVVDDEDSSIGARARDLLDTCPSFIKAECYTHFINHHKEKLKKYKVPWYIPEEYGGYGLPILTELTPGEDIDDRKINVIRGPSRLDLLLFRQVVRSGKVVTARSFPTWKTFELVREQLSRYVMRPSPVQEHDKNVSYIQRTSEGETRIHTDVRAPIFGDSTTFVSRIDETHAQGYSQKEIEIFHRMTQLLESAVTCSVFFTEPLTSILDDSPMKKLQGCLRENEKLWTMKELDGSVGRFGRAGLSESQRAGTLSSFVPCYYKEQ